MAALINGVRVAQQITSKNPLVLYTAVRNLAAWNKDFKPDKFPQTQKEIEAAAKKYYLQPEDYQPYADDGLGYGDYPKLKPGLGIEAKDPYYPYDYPEHKRNFHDTFNADIDVYGEDRFSQPDHPRLANSAYWLSFLGVMGGCLALYYWLEDYKMFRPVIAKQYPRDGKVHYVFDADT